MLTCKCDRAGVFTRTSACINEASVGNTVDCGGQVGQAPGWIPEKQRSHVSVSALSTYSGKIFRVTLLSLGVLLLLPLLVIILILESPIKPEVFT